VFDRGPLDEDELITAGYWSTYWYGGYIYGTEIARGLDVFALNPSDYLTANEIAAASLQEVNLTVNAQTQVQAVWPAVPVVARAYIDQLQRSNVITNSQVQQLDSVLSEAERAFSSNSSDSHPAFKVHKNSISG
jgi:delta 1-pyrroline-5-carboxylate dehydrogenase